MNYDVITIGGATEDITVYTNEGVIIDNPEDILRQKLIAFEFGAKLKVDRAYSTFGGGAANAAVCLSRLGFKAAALVSLGQDERGKRITANFEKQKVLTDAIQRWPDQDTGFSFLLVGQGNEHVVFSNRAANTRLMISAADRRRLERSEWVYLTSLSGKWQSVLKSIFSAEGPLIAWNPGHIQLHAGASKIGKYLKKTEVLIVNKDEAIELAVSAGRPGPADRAGLNNVKNLLRLVKDCGPRIAVITSGKQGADAYDGEKFYHQNVIKEKRRLDTTGVGDAFGSSFVAGLRFFKGDIAKAMHLGAKNTASVISRQGAQNGLLSKRDLGKIIK